MKKPKAEVTTTTLAVRARGKALTQFARCWNLATSKGEEIKDSQIEFINILKECGRWLGEATGHEQLSLEHFNFIQKDLPPEVDFGRAKICMQLARSPAVKDFAEARLQLDLALQAVGAIAAPHRELPGTATDRYSLTWFVNTVSSFNVTVDQFTKRTPLEQLGRAELQTVVAQTRHLAELHLKAKALLE